MAGERNVSYFSVDTVLTDDDQNIDALMSNRKWDTSTNKNITYSFIDQASDYSYSFDPGKAFVSALNSQQQTAARNALAQVAAIADVTFTELAFGSADGTLRFAEVSGINTAYAYYPSTTERGGDMAFHHLNYDTPGPGNSDFSTFIHELGHAMGLKHGHETSFGGKMTDDRNSTEFSIMTYNSFVGHDRMPPHRTNEADSNPQTFMMYDIAALQRLYGVNWTTNNGDSTYTFNTTTGEMSINGSVYQTPTGNKIYLTIWDGGGEDTYDLSNYTNELDLDLTPGGWSDFDKGGNAQRAMINQGWDSTGTYVGSAAREWARAHVFNALQFEGDERSLIENAIGGSGNDTITGNIADNSLSGNGGDDTLYGGDGEDRLYGGAGNDAYYGGDDDDYMKAGGGAESFYGGSGSDTLSYYGSTDGVSVNLTTNSVSGSWAADDTISSIENITTSQTGDDVVTGTSGANLIKTSGGDDSIYALGGSDKVYAGSGDDYVRVGGGVESFYGGSGDDDYISYYDSSGGITIDLAANTITGSWGNNDVISGFESVGGSRTGDDKMYGTSGANRLKGYGGDDSFWGGSGNDKVYGGSGDDYVRVGGGVESFYGGSGSDDYISYYDSSGGITIDLAANTVTGSWANNDVISGFESVGGSRTGDDKMYGTSGANRLKGYGGDDSFWGGSGNDKVYGGSGDDYVRVGGGVESFYGGSGSDDYISYYDSSGGITIDLAANTITGSWANNDVISGFESAGGSRTGADKMYGTSGANRLKSYGGDDSLWGRSGDDKLYGGSGADRFDGGNGDDTLYGGSGDDIFHFDRGEDNDIIKDFENNDDTIQFDNFGYLTDAASALAFATETGGDVLFNFGADGTLRVENATKAQLVNDIEIV